MPRMQARELCVGTLEQLQARGSGGIQAGAGRHRWADDGCCLRLGSDGRHPDACLQQNRCAADAMSACGWTQDSIYLRAGSSCCHRVCGLPNSGDTRVPGQSQPHRSCISCTWACSRLLTAANACSALPLTSRLLSLVSEEPALIRYPFPTLSRQMIGRVCADIQRYCSTPSFVL